MKIAIKCTVAAALMMQVVWAQTPEPAKPEPAKITQWEYKFGICDLPSAGFGGQEQLTNCLNSLGVYGWELVGTPQFLVDGFDRTAQFVLKRPTNKPAEPDSPATPPKVKKDKQKK